MSKILSKDIAAFHYFEKTLIVLSATSGGISIISFRSVNGVPVRIARASFSLVFSLTTGIIKKLLEITRNNIMKFFLLAKSKLISIETLISQALIDLEISHEEFKTIANEKEKHEKMKENIRMIKSSHELSENNKNIRENNENA